MVKTLLNFFVYGTKWTNLFQHLVLEGQQEGGYGAKSHVNTHRLGQINTPGQSPHSMHADVLLSTPLPDISGNDIPPSMREKRMASINVT